MHEKLTHPGRSLLRAARMAFMLMLLCIGSISASAAPGAMKNISGNVIDVEGEPVIGATVTVKGTSTACSTDIDGNYTIKAAEGQTLVVTYIGCHPEEAVVGASDVINFALRTNAEALDEVVVVGYGTVKKKDLTGAVGAVNGDKMVERHTTQLSSALQGAMSGVQVLRTAGGPSAGASSIRVRGVTTMGTSDPLILVDGVPEDNIDNINANDVESISVLKDAASAAIYGARAAAGVVLITTKRANEKDLKVSYNFEYGLEMPAAQPKNVGPRRWMEMVNELSYNDNPAGGWNQLYTQDEVENWVARNATDPDNYPITDWFDFMTKGSAPRQSHVVSLTGGSKSVKSRATFSYDRNGSLLKDVDHNYSRYLVRVNNDFKFNKYISANLDVNVKYTEGIAPAFSSVWSGIYNASELYAPIWSNGTLGDVKNGSNPYGKLVYGGNTKSTNLRAGGKAGLTITPIEGLKLQAIAAPNISFAKSKEFTNAVPFYYADDPNTIQGYLGDYGTTNLTEGRADSKEFTGQFLGNYAKKFGKHDLNVMLGYETYYFRHESMSAGTKDMTLDRYPYLSSANKELLTVAGTAYELAYRSLFGRLMYNFDDRYLLQVNFRRDGSSRFHKDYRWGNFPSVSLGWVLTEEKFMEKINHRTLSFLKIRGSWGRLGNERIGSNYYPYISLLDFSNSMYYPSQDATTPVFAQGAAQVQYAIRDISWETTESFDFGIDARFFDGRLSFTGDIYRKNTKGMLLSLDIPDYVGYTNPKQNAGKMHTTGWDIELGWNDRIGDVSYSVTFNMSDYRSKMGNLSGSFVDGTKVIMEGSYYNEWYGYISDGLFQDETDLANSPKLTEAATQVGDVKFRDISGPDGIPDGKISPEYDRVLLGNSLPELMYGGTIAAQWNGFDLSMAFQGVGHQNVRMTESMIQPYRGKWGSIPEIIDGQYWSSLNTPEQNAAATYPRLTTTNKDSNNEMSTFWMFNGRYFRMKNITVGYTIPQKITRKFFVDRLRVYVSGNDLFSINDYPQGFDPERTVSNYPITKSVIFGLNVNF